MLKKDNFLASETNWHNAFEEQTVASLAAERQSQTVVELVVELAVELEIELAA